MLLNYVKKYQYVKDTPIIWLGYHCIPNLDNKR